MLDLDHNNTLKLDAPYFSGKGVSLLGAPGSGKSTGARRLVEQLTRFVPAGTIVDLDGDHIHLGDRFDHVVVAGGDYGEKLTYADALASRSFEQNKLVVLDLSGLRREKMFEYLTEYLEELWRLISPLEARKPYLLMFEEAHTYVPEGRVTPVSDLINDLASRGRKRGFIVIYTTQFPQQIAKRVLRSCPLHFFHRVNLNKDKDVIAEYTPRPAKRVYELVDELRAPGDCIFVDGSRVQVVSMLESETPGTGGTPMIVVPEAARAPYMPLLPTPMPDDTPEPWHEAARAERFAAGYTQDAQRAGGLPDDAVDAPAAIAPAPLSGSHTTLLTQRGEGSEKASTFPWAGGCGAAWTFTALFADLCTRCSVGGSLRRSNPQLGDVELIMQPLPERVDDFMRRWDLLLQRGFVELRLNKNGNRIAWSTRWKALLYKTLPVDVFITLPDRQWGPNAIIRTGGHRANLALVQTAGLKTAEGDLGILPPGMKFDDGVLWHYDQRLDTPEEWDVYNAIGLPWIPPHLRSPETYARAAAGRFVAATGGADVGRQKDWGSARQPDGLWLRLDPALKLRQTPELAALLHDLQNEPGIPKQEQLL